MRGVVLALSVFAFAAAACGQAGAPSGSTEASAQTVAADPTAFDEEITAWARARHGANLFEPVNTFYGDFNGDGAEDGLAFAYFALGGSSAGLNVALFRNEGGHMVHHRDIEDVFGMEPRDAVFSEGSVQVTTLTLGPNDPRCCPTQPREWTISTD